MYWEDMTRNAIIRDELHIYVDSLNEKNKRNRIKWNERLGSREENRLPLKASIGKANGR